MGEREADAIWIKKKVEGWAESVRTLSGVYLKHLQCAYAGLQKSLNQEWEFVQQVTPGIGDAFGPVEEEIKTAFIPEIFYSVGDEAPGRAITRLPLNQAALALPDPTRTAPDNWQASCVITGHLVSALRGQVTFRTADHAACLRDGRAAVRWKSVAKSMVSLEATIAGAPEVFTHRL